MGSGPRPRAATVVSWSLWEWTCEALGHAGEPGARLVRGQPGRLHPKHAAGARQRPPPNRGRRPAPDDDEPRDRTRVLGARQGRGRRRDDRARQAPHGPRRLAAGRPEGRARDRRRRDAPPDLGWIRITPQGHRRRRVPVDPGGRRASDDPNRPEHPEASAGRDGLRRCDRRGPPDPDRRPLAVRRRDGDVRRGGQLPDRGQDDPPARSRLRCQRGHPGPGPERAHADPRRHRRADRRRPRAESEPGAFPPGGHRPGQPADRWPVPELPVRPAEDPHDPRDPRPRGAPAGGPSGGPDRPRVREYREAPDRHERRGRDHGQRQRRDRRPRGPGRGGGRGRWHVDRLQREVPRGRPREGHRGAVRPRAPGPARARRVQAGRRRPLRPRRHAGPHHLLTPDEPERLTASISAAAPTVLGALRLDGFRGYASLDARFGPGPHLIWGPNAAGKTSLLEAIVLLAWGHSHRSTVDVELIRWGDDVARIEGHVGPVAGDPQALEVALVRPGSVSAVGGARKRIRVNGVARRTTALGAHLRVVLFAPEDMLLVIGSPSLRRGLLDRLASQLWPAYADALATYGRALQQRNS